MSDISPITTQTEIDLLSMFMDCEAEQLAEIDKQINELEAQVKILFKSRVPVVNRMMKIDSDIEKLEANQ